MTYTDIDKQFDEKWYTLHDAGGFEVSEKVREFIHQIYDQAKAEGYQAAIEDMNEDKAYKENKL